MMMVPSGETDVRTSFSFVPSVPESLKVIFKQRFIEYQSGLLLVGEEQVRHPQLLPEIIFANYRCCSFRNLTVCHSLVHIPKLQRCMHFKLQTVRIKVFEEVNVNSSMNVNRNDVTLIIPCCKNKIEIIREIFS